MNRDYGKTGRIDRMNVPVPADRSHEASELRISILHHAMTSASVMPVFFLILLIPKIFQCSQSQKQRLLFNLDMQ